MSLSARVLQQQKQKQALEKAMESLKLSAEQQLLSIDTKGEEDKKEVILENHEADIKIDMEDEAGDTTTSPSKIMVVSDIEYTDAIKKSLDDSVFKCYSELFINRSCADLAKGYDRVWLNISESKQRRWLQSNLKKNKSYKVVAVSYRTVRSKWISDIRDYVDSVVKVSDLKKMVLGGDLEDLSSMVSIHKTVSCLGKLLKCSANLHVDGKKDSNF